MQSRHVSTAKAEAFGHVLRAAREQAGLRIDDVAARLRVPRVMILAIEAGAISALPKPPYINGHWRAYADFIAATLPCWDDTRDAMKTVEPGATTSTEAMQAPRLCPAAASRGRVAGRPLLAVPLLVLALAGLAVLLTGNMSNAPAVGERVVADATFIAAPVRPLPMIAVPALEALTAPGSEPRSPAPPALADARPARIDASPPQPLLAITAAAPPTLKFVARAEVWVQLGISSPRRSLVARILKAGDVVSVPLEPEMVLSIGAPQNISVFLDDRELPIARFIQRGVISSARVSRLTAAD